MEMKESSGGEAWVPQQATEPLGLTPHVRPAPALTEVKEPSGGEACPLRSLPQQVTDPSVLTPQLWLDPALTEVNAPAGGEARPLPL